MTESERYKMLTIIDGQNEAIPFVFQIDKFRRREEILDYLIRNRITGKKIIAYFQDEKRSILNMIADVLRRIDKRKNKAKIIGGKDYFFGR